MRSVAICGGPAPFREALTARLQANGWSVGERADVEVVVQFCDGEVAWTELAASLSEDRLGCVAVLTRLDPALYRRALQLGAGVVYHDTSTEIIVHVIESAAHGEALIPMEVARHVATSVGTESPGGVGALTSLERSLLRGLADGDSVGALGARFHYSERTIRRRLQSAYLKIGVENRAEAIRRIEREQLLD